MTFLVKVRHAIHKHHMLRHSQLVIVAVSGGPDSLCLLHALFILQDELDITLHIAHLNHQLRGIDADADAQFIADLARDWQLPCTIDARDVATFAREHKLSIEEAARAVRYSFLAEIAQAQNSNTIAIAHNADDQAETVLMHFLRGSGTSGLRGMLPITDLQSPTSNLKLIRPLLSIPRTEIEAYCREHDLHPRFDRSNLDTTFFRNRLRHELLPILETYNPNIREILRRTADVIAAEHALLQHALNMAWRVAIKSESDHDIVFGLNQWRALPLGLQRATLRQAIEQLRPSLRDIHFIHIEDAVEQLQTAQTGARVSLPKKLMLSVDYDTFTIASASQVLALPDWPLLPQHTASISISVPGTIRLPGSDWSLTTMLSDADNIEPTGSDQWSALLDADRTGNDLSMRTRTSGDIFHPQGMPSRVRLTHWMTNTKIPQRTREHLPLIIARDQIAWVAGFRVAQPFTVTSDTTRVIQLKFHK